AHIDRDVEAVVDLRQLVVALDDGRRHSEGGRRRVVEPADRIAAAARETRIERRGDAVGIEVAGADRGVPRRLDRAPRRPEITGGETDVPPQLMLDLYGLLPVVRARAKSEENAGVVDRRIRVVQPEVAIAYRAADVAAACAEVLRDRAREIAVGREVAVGIGPRRGGVEDRACHRGI